MFEQIMEHASISAEFAYTTEPDRGDYDGPDGLRRCGCCHQPRQMRLEVPLIGTRVVYVMCECEKARREAEDMIRAAKENGLHTAVESTANAPYEDVEKILPYLDLYLMDIKHMDSTKHAAFTTRRNEKILENARKYLPFLNEKEEYGTVAEKILKIMEFRIPYYAGPLVGREKSDNAWMKRKAEGKIYPWNFIYMVDEDASENEFIRRMTCKCTYLAGEDVLPKYSLLYSKFMVLNEINNIKVNGEPISVEAKQKLYQEKFVESKARVTKKRIKEFLVSIGEYGGDVEVTGVDDTIKSSLRSYHDFKRFIECGLLKEFDVEKIIERITVTTDAKRLKNWLEQE